MAESAVQAKIIRHLKDKGAYVIKTIVTNRAGVPDIIACYKGRFIAIECKDKGKKKNVTELQLVHINKIIDAGGKAIVVDCVEDVEELLNDTSITTPS